MLAPTLPAASASAKPRMYTVSPVRDIIDRSALTVDAFAGQTIRIAISAADASTASLVEAGVDDLRVTRD